MDQQIPRKETDITGYVVVIFVLLLLGAFAFFANRLTTQQTSTNSRAFEVPTVAGEPTPAYPHTTAECGKLKINCNRWFKNAGLVPTNANMGCVKNTANTDGVCAFVITDTQALSCPLVKNAWMAISTTDTTMRCMYVARSIYLSGELRTCRILETKIPKTESDCTNFTQ